jgi:hypothetical protein
MAITPGNGVQPVFAHTWIRNKENNFAKDTGKCSSEVYPRIKIEKSINL